MSADETFETLKNYLENEEVAQRALRHLKEGVEVAVVIGERVEAAVGWRDSNVYVERRPAHKPDVIFHVVPETVYVLNNLRVDDVGDFGIAVFKEILAGNVRVKFPGSLLSFTRNGYLNILKEGGQKVWDYLAEKGIMELMKIQKVVAKLRKSN
jgi:hypothetical protein